MEQKYLPIGSVCTLKGKSKKVMIIGYYSVEFNGNLRIRDYQGCIYPEGMLLPEQVCTFNHSDIETIDFFGYKNDDQYKFQRHLDRIAGNENDEEKAKNFHEENEMILTSSKSYSKLLFDENGVLMIAEPVVETSNTPTNIRFDENGYVISSENNSNVNNPFYKDYESTNLTQENSNSWDIFNKIEFDENGVVIEAEEKNEIPREQMLNKIEFDENGVVISVNNSSSAEHQNKNNKYQFDENGVLVAINEVADNSASENIENEELRIKKVSNYNFDSEGTVIDEEIYEFDTEGNLISVNSAHPEEKNGEIDQGSSVDDSSRNNSKYKFDEEGVLISVEDAAE